MNQIVIPSIPILIILDILMIIPIIILVYRRYGSVNWPFLLRLIRRNVPPRTLIIVDGQIADHNPKISQTNPFELQPASSPKLTGAKTPRVDIVDASTPPIAHWIAEVEHQLAIYERLPR
jgi:hypothetical protein